ncbi:MAG TPA: SBBP repeat-containing protein [Bacteroidia bacterium]|jgi:hypothetical protein|nr:SBBP repeat-containing protein [Bacteroidia bacterium]
MRQAFIFLFFFFFTGKALNAQSWLWAKQAVVDSGSYGIEGWDMAADHSGNYVCTGYFDSRQISFGSFILYNRDTSAGSNDIFIVKYDAAGNVLWATSAGSNYYDASYGVAVDPSGNIFVAGYFFSPQMIFGNDTLYADSADVSTAIFLAKYDANGNFLWAQRAGGHDEDEALDIAADDSGNAVITGYTYSDTMVFGTDTLYSYLGKKVFIAKYDANGNELWAKAPGGEAGNGISVNSSGKILVTGYFGSTISFDTITLNSMSPENVFLAELNNSGTCIWAKCGEGSTPFAEGIDVAVDPSDNVYLSAWFKQYPVTFDTITVNSTNYYKDALLVKFDTSGHALWAHKIGGTGDDVGNALAADPAGNIYFSGGFSSPFVVAGTDTLHFPAGAQDPLFLVKYDANGNLLCDAQLNGGGDDNNGLVADSSGNVYVCGDFYSPPHSIPFVAGTDTLISEGTEDFFIAKYNCDISTSIYQVEKNTMKIFPNPSGGVFHIETHNAGGSELLVYDVYGKVVLDAEDFSGNNEIDLRDQPSGVYFLELFSASEKFSTVLVKE